MRGDGAPLRGAARTQRINPTGPGCPLHDLSLRSCACGRGAGFRWSCSSDPPIQQHLTGSPLPCKRPGTVAVYGKSLRGTDFPQHALNVPCGLWCRYLGPGASLPENIFSGTVCFVTCAASANCAILPLSERECGGRHYERTGIVTCHWADDG